MYMKKRGFALLETLIVINILIVLISLYAKQNFINLRKASFYTIKEDILTLDNMEEQLINQVENDISLDMQLITKLKEDGVSEKVKFVSENDKNLYIEIVDKEVYLIHKKGLDKKYRKLDYTILSESEIKLSPTRYLTEYINY